MKSNLPNRNNFEEFPYDYEKFFFLEFPVYHVDIWNITLTIQNNFDGFS